MQIKQSMKGKSISRKIKFVLLFCFLVIAGQVVVKAQDAVNVSGHVISKDDGTPIVGAAVFLKGGKGGVATTDTGGVFNLRIPIGTTIIIKAVGYPDQEVRVTNKTLDISLLSTAGGLEEVVIVGAVVKKKDLTGAVASLSAAKIAETPTTSINQAIQGRLPGVLVTSSPNPGSDASIKIRGNNSMQFGANPIFVVDGTIIDGGFNTLNPDDIESVDVLKDASATAIYGSRGANGVVLVSTKKGKKGEGKVSYNTWVGWQGFSKKMPLMNAQQMYDLRVDAFTNAHMDSFPTADRQQYVNMLKSANSPIFAPFEQQTIKDGKSYNWLDAVTRTGIQQNHTLSFSGASDKGAYFVSFNYTDQQGLIKESGYKRMGGRINIDQNIKPWLKVGTNTQFTRTIQNIVDDGVFSTAVNANPMQPIDTADYWMKWAGLINRDQYNPLRTLYISNKQYSSRILSSNYINVNPIEGLNIRSTLSLDFTYQQQYKYIPSNTGQDLRNNYHGNANQYKGENENLQWDNTASYTKQFGKHRLNALLGTSMMQQVSNYNQIDAYGFPSDDFTYKYLNGSYLKNQNNISSDFVKSTMMSYLARAEYSYAGKYFATATVRRDGSSKFGANNRWGTFPSLALAWDMGKEDFMRDASWINSLKWRASYGIAGNQNIPNYANVTNYRPQYSNGQVVVAPSGYLGNPDLRWERQKQLNFGIDLAFLQNRLTASLDYFNTNNTDLLIARTVSTSIGGLGTQIQNIGAMHNRGIELNLGYAIIQNKDLQWNFNATVSADKNKITKLYGDVPAIYNLGGFTGVERQATGNYILGQSVNTIYMWKFKKIAQQSDMATINNINYGGRQIHPGDIIPVDVNGDKIISEDDKTVVGKMDPKFYGGFGTNVTYKGFGLNAFFNYSYGKKRLSNYYAALLSSGGMSAASPDLANRWTPENTNTLVPRALYGGSRFNVTDVDLGVQNASFLRLSTFTLSYNLPSTMTQRLRLGSVKVYATGTNMWLLTKDKGYDPETGDWYPNSKTFVLGLNVSF